MTDTVQIEKRGVWTEITLNRPDKLNAFNDEMCQGLLSALKSAQDSGARAVLITGAGRGFCAGQDLEDTDPASGQKPDLGAVLRDGYNPIIELVTDMPCPVICAVNGVAAGAGASLAFASDIVLAAENAKFVLPFARIGLIPGAGSSWTLSRAIGLPRAKALAMTGGQVTAAEAQTWGLIWKCLPPEDLMSEARSLAAKLGNGPTFGLAQAKQALNAAADHDLAQHLEYEASLQTACGRSDDYAEGVAAFRTKRAPKFTGAKP